MIKGALNEKVIVEIDRLVEYEKGIYEEKLNASKEKAFAQNICIRNPRGGRFEITEVT